jgi:AcrR family transcriptional regulator
MPTKRYDNLDPAMQRRLLDAAQAEFTEHGYEAASLNRIIATAGMSKGSLYYYFENKADLYGTLTEDIGARLNARIFADGLPEPDGSFWEFLEVATHRKLQFLLEHPHLARLFGDVLRLSKQPSVPEPIRAIMARNLEQTCQFISQAQATGDIRTDVSCAFLAGLWQAIGDAVTDEILDQVAKGNEVAVGRLAELSADLLRRVSVPA